MARPQRNDERMPIPPGDPLAGAHRAIFDLTDEAIARTSRAYPYGYGTYRALDLEDDPTGRAMLAAPPEAAREFVLAALAQVQHREASSVNDAEFHVEAPGGIVPLAVLDTLLRRPVALDAAELAALVRWCWHGPDHSVGRMYLDDARQPLAAVATALERFATHHPLSDSLRAEARSFAGLLAATVDQQWRIWRTRLAYLIEARPEPAEFVLIPPEAAGSSLVLRDLKRWLGLRLDGPEPATVTVGRDRFPLAAGSPLRAEHDWLTAAFEAAMQPGTPFYPPKRDRWVTKDWSPPPPPVPEPNRPPAPGPDGTTPLGLVGMIPAESTDEAGRFGMAIAERHIHALATEQVWTLEGTYWGPAEMDMNLVKPGETTTALTHLLAGTGAALPRPLAFDLLLYLLARPTDDRYGLGRALQARLIDEAEVFAAAEPLTAGERHLLAQVRNRRVAYPAFGRPTAEVQRLTRLIGDGANVFFKPGEVWSDAANADLSQLDSAGQDAWAELLKFAYEARNSGRTRRWLATGRTRVAAIGLREVERALLRWLPLVPNGRVRTEYPAAAPSHLDQIDWENARILRGLIWLAPTLPITPELTRLLGLVAATGFRKIPRYGPRSLIVGNAAVLALTELASAEALATLATLRAGIKNKTVRKAIDAALAAAGANPISRPTADPPSRWPPG